MLALLAISLSPALDCRAQNRELKSKFGLDEAWHGDLDAMLARRTIRALVVHNPMLYFLDGARKRGASYDALKAFEEFVNERVESKHLKLRILFIPVSRDRLLPALTEGIGDIAAANLTITEERAQRVDFSYPILTDVSEILVTGPTAEEIHSDLDLCGKKMVVRRSSSYYQSVQRLNGKCGQAGRQPIDTIPAGMYLEDADLLEMVNAGAIPMVVVDSHKADFWADVFDGLTVRRDIVLNSGGEIAWAFRKDSPKLKEIINEFVKKTKKGTLLGNILFKRYLKENKWARNATSEAEIAKFRATVDLFRKYGEKYAIDWLMLGAMAYQESRLDHSMRSPRGAIGIMQILPSTAADPNVNIADITKLENNIHAGTKYLEFLRSRYFTDPDIDMLNRILFSFAAYNAGPARVAELRKEAEASKLDPNVWFDNVEIIAAKRIGRETVQYTSNIYKYYIAYSLIHDQLTAKRSDSASSAR